MTSIGHLDGGYHPAHHDDLFGVFGICLPDVFFKFLHESAGFHGIIRLYRFGIVEFLGEQVPQHSHGCQ